eukprot:2247150-Amphidinium_carterae.2
MEKVHGPHHLKPAFRECSLEAVAEDRERRDCAHRSDAALGNQSFEAVCEDLEDANSPHHLEPTFRERALEAVSAIKKDVTALIARTPLSGIVPLKLFVKI